ncbi:transglycosylase domain-containing protein [Cryptosporangium sp. NPDC048952]|uniref:transglycosylase domain-containing protein n=1 Tax=Cryptosporangium sp. NPDC048952 TaxID=3363961 RepID=UPI0037197073
MPKSPRKASWWRVVGIVLALGPTLFLLGVAGAYFTLNVPKFPDQSLTTRIRYADGTQFATFALQNRVEVQLADVPKHVQDAVVAAEDADFWQNSGVSLRGTARAIWGVATGDQSAGGGSTITQQYVRNALDLTRSRSVTRKFREIMLARKLNSRMSKPDILQAYLNTIYFGRGAWGIQVAAKAYFGKTVDQLTVSEGAVLAAVIKDPSNFDPANKPAGAKDRWAYVLDRMEQKGFLSSSNRDRQTYPVLRSGRSSGNSAWRTGSNGVLGYRIEQELKKLGFSEQVINTGGLIVKTTISRNAQSAATRAAHRYVNSRVQDSRLASAVVSIDPRNGAVRAYYGGDRGYGNLDLASAGAPHPAGSSFKPYVLAAGIDAGYGIDSLWNGTSGQTFPDRSTPLRNSGDDNSCGSRCSLTSATVKSLNTVYWALTDDVGPRTVARTAAAAGITSLDGEPIRMEMAQGINAGIGIGQYSVPVLDHAAGYATLAAYGKYHEPYFVDEVLASDGKAVLWSHATHADPGTQAINRDVARDVGYVLQRVYEANSKNRIGRPAAVKTGTQQYRDTSENAHAWLCGFTPQLATAVWVGSGGKDFPLRDRANGNIRVYGSGLPGSIWRDYMRDALRGQKIEEFLDPVHVGTKKGNAPAAPPPRSATPTDSPTSSETPSDAPSDAPSETPVEQITEDPTLSPSPLVETP